MDGPGRDREEPRTRVLYIAGSGRSGSTLLALLLGQIEGMVAPGEVRFVFERGVVQNRLCGCGLAFHQCPHWREVIERAFGEAGLSATGAAEAVRGQAGVTRVRSLPVSLLSRRLPGLLRRRAGVHLGRLAALYPAVAATAGATVVVDSSKLPTYGRLLEAAPGLDLRVVHLIRDPRATAHSWSRHKPQLDQGTGAVMERLSPLRAAGLWVLWNLVAEISWAGRRGRYLRLRYEDLLATPRATLHRLSTLAGVEAGSLDFIEGSTARLAPAHTAAGNPDRFRRGPTAIRPDLEWMEAMPRRSRLLVTLVTGPLLLRYGYPLFPRAPRHRAPAADADARALSVQRLPAPARFLRRLGRHWRWARSQGARRLIEEDQLAPLGRARSAAARRRWRRTHPQPAGAAMPVFLAGVQRSGTNMLARSLEVSPAVEVHNENDGAAFDRFRLRDPASLRGLVGRSGQRYVVLKSLIDSHRLGALLDGLGTPTAPRAIWIYRSAEARARSAVAKFGDNNLRVLRTIAAGRAEGLWQAEGLSVQALEVIRGQDYERLDPLSAAALFWYVRNSLYFDLGLAGRADVLLVSYQRLVESPEPQLKIVCDFLGLEPAAAMAARIDPGRELRRPRPAMDPAVRALCSELERRLEAALPLGETAARG